MELERLRAEHAVQKKLGASEDLAVAGPAKERVGGIERELAAVLASSASQGAELRTRIKEDRIDGLEFWHETERAFSAMVGLRAEDDRTFVVELERPTPYFLDLCAYAVFYPVYPPLVQQYERPDPRTGRLKVESGWTKPPTLVTNGPFLLTTWRFKRDMRFIKNPEYWDQSLVKVRSVEIPSMEDPNAQVLAYRSGAVDWVSEVTPPYRADMLAEKEAFYREHAAEVARLRAEGLNPVEVDRRLPDDPRKDIHAYPTFGTYFYNFNCRAKMPDGRENPFADKRVRRAFAMAVNREKVTKEVRRIGERVAGVLVPPGSIAGYRSPVGLKYDPAGARRLLAEAGYPEGRGFITVEILFNKDAGHDVIAQSIAEDWRQNLGVAVQLVQKEIKVFRNDLKNHNFMVSRAGWYGDYGDPTTFLELNRTGDGNNDRDFSSKQYDALLDAAREEPDPAKRLETLTQAERLIVEEELPLIPIFHYVQIYLFDADEMRGISWHPRQEQNMYLVEMYGKGASREPAPR